ncbi:MAG: hypothetical protein JWO38_4407 [Gemmataceae bacterium]|nr:hypothetical protein [Gemmataceae bacterium]
MLGGVWGPTMTEVDWHSGTRPTAMLLAVRDLVSPRKVVLFGCACCRRIWSRLGPADRKAVEQAEAAADDPAAFREFLARLEPERVAALAVAGLLAQPVDDALTSLLETQTALRLRLDGDRGWGIGSLAFEAARLAVEGEPEARRQVARAREEVEQAALAREVFGNPFHPPAVEASWSTPPVVALARQVYETRDFGPMPILADALQDAGCENADVLGHCRSDGPHVRGCWVVDLVLGNS